MYVFFNKNNPIVQDYWQKYINLIRGKYLDLAKKWYIRLNKTIVKSENLSFRKYWDINSVINFLATVTIKWFDNQFFTREKFDKYVHALEKQINFFLSNESDKLIFNQGKKIANTDIYLSDKDLNPYNTMDTHPDHNWVWLWRWEVWKSKWYEIYNKTFHLIKKIDEGIWYELNEMIDKIIPLGTSYINIIQLLLKNV